MELAGMLIWTLRILLPVVIFWIYFVFLAPKDEAPAPSGVNVYSRRELLDQRNLAGAKKPEGIAGITLKGLGQAPALFSGGRGGRPSGGGGGGGQPGRRGGEGREREPRRERRGSGGGPPVAAAAVVTAGMTAEERAAKEKMHLEALLNFVAFNPTCPQRFLLPDEATPPPPPKKKPPRSAAGAPLIGASGSTGILFSSAPPAVSGEAAQKANAEAQIVLAGAVRFRRSDVAHSLYARLLESQVEISADTFALMIEASVLARDLKSASDFLMKLESSGYCPDTALLDKVMDLYSLQKSQREQERQRRAAAELKPTVGARGPGAGAEQTARSPLEVVEAMLGHHLPDMEDAEAIARSRLSSAARVFVPSFGIPPPPPKPAAAGGASGDADAGASARAPSAEAAPAAPAEAARAQEQSDGEAERQRTRLTASAQPFQPQFDMMYDYDASYMYVWPGDAPVAELTAVDGAGERGKGAVRKRGRAKIQGGGRESAAVQAKEEETWSGGGARWRPKAQQ